jgi:purine-binding chemotaxis protein CheW
VTTPDTRGGPADRAGATDQAAYPALAELLADGGGGFLLGTLHVALPLRALREVVGLTPLRCVPGQAAGLVGAIDLRGALLPVLDLRQLLCRLPNDAAHPCVVVMVHQGRLLGLLADQVTGTFRCAANGMHRVRGDGLSSMFAASVRREGDNELVNLLSAQTLASLPGLPLIDDPEPERSALFSDAEAQARIPASRPLMLLRLGRQMLAIDAVAVRSTHSAPEVQASALAIGHCRGVVENLGLRLPAIDLSDYCGMGGAKTATTAASGDMLVVPAGGGSVGLLVDAVTDVVAVAADAIARLPALAEPRAGLFAGSLPANALPESSRARLPAGCGQLLVLDSAALAQQPDLQALAAAASTPPAGASHQGTASAQSAGTGAPDTSAPAMLVFGLKGEWCVAVSQVREILSLTGPALTAPPRAGDGLLLGLLSDRGRAIPVLDLARLLDDAPAGTLAPQAALLVEQSGEWLGFAVHRLSAIEHARRQPRLPARRTPMAGDGLASPHHHPGLAELGSGAESRLVRVVELVALASELSRGAGARAAVAPEPATEPANAM